MEINTETFLNNDEKADKIGARLADILYLKHDIARSDRWPTDWGNKTNAGLARTVLAILEGKGIDGII